MPSSSSRPVVLLLEEDSTQRSAIAEHLGEGGFEVAEAADSDRALAVLEKRSDIRAVVTDAHVPGAVDGYAFAQMVRERWPEVATIMCSGHSDASSGPVPEGGAFIAKPYLFERLLPTLQDLMKAPSSRP